VTAPGILNCSLECLSGTRLSLGQFWPEIDEETCFQQLAFGRRNAMRYGCLSEIRHMASGTVKWFNSQKGYGFIQPTGGGRDVFVHISAVERAGLSSLNEGQRVEFEIMENRGRTSAENLRVR
jgi:cold shock protein